ncbi:unnamed protein product [Ilex paraguariensis]|uniref:Uncharacterized protein n=1 Tax=Ilex paraguariensis TaxID=185542 RepID=A0ABC8UK40_9AQUA
MTMSGCKLSEAREVTRELGDQRPLLVEGGEMQEVIVIRDEVGNDRAIDVKANVHAGVGKATSVGEDAMGTAKGETPWAPLGEATQDADGEVVWTSAGGRANHEEGIAVGWARLGQGSTQWHHRVLGMVWRVRW